MSKTTDKQQQELQRLAELPDEDIDTGDIPEVGDFPVPFEVASTDRSNSR